ERALHTIIVGTAAAFRWHPVDDLVWIHDVTSLAMNTVGKVDMKLLARRGLARVNHFVNSRRAKILAWIAEFFATATVTNIQVFHNKVHRLIIVMPRARVVDIGKAIERQLSIALCIAQKRCALSTPHTQLIELSHPQISGMVLIVRPKIAAPHKVLNAS